MAGERAVNALGRIGRGCFSNIEMYWEELFSFSEFVRPYLPKLQKLSETDENRVVRIHASGAIRAAGLF